MKPNKENPGPCFGRACGEGALLCEWAMGPILNLGYFRRMNSKEIDFPFYFKYCPHMQRN
jgi:hypothetical protein